LVSYRNYTVHIFAGNEGGFESIGKAVNFITNIPCKVLYLILIYFEKIFFFFSTTLFVY